MFARKQRNPYDIFQNPIRVARKNADAIPLFFKERGLAGTDEQIGYKNNPTGSGAAPVGPYAHGNGGIFAVPGQQPQVFSAMLLPQAGVLDDLPILYQGLGQEFDGGNTQFGGVSSPLHTYITGLTSGNLDNVANQPTLQCAVGPEGGLLKACTVTMPYGKYRGSFSLNIEKIATLRDYADPTYLQMMNAPLQTNAMAPTMLGNGNSLNNNVLIDEFTKRAFQTGSTFKRLIASRVFAGNPTNSVGSDNWQDIEGFDLQINSGTHVDTFSKNICTALDSDLKDFASRIVSVGSNGAALYVMADMLVRFVQWTARRTGLGQCTWKWWMHPNTFDEITKIWPVEQYTESLLAMNAFNNGRVVVDGEAMVKLRDAMREGSYLPIRNQTFEVIQDDTITELDVTSNAALLAGQYSSGMYFAPYTVLGGMPITYIQPFNFANGIMDNVQAEGRLLHTFVTDGGLFRWYVYYTGPCVQWDFVNRFRVRTHAPQIAGRIQNVGYAPLQHIRSYNPSSPYFADGGRTSGPTAPQSYYTDWSVSTPVVIP